MEAERCLLENLTFEPSFFQGEVREGFYVSTMMKRYWASQLKVLSLVAQICKRHDIRWFAEYGTLLGAVRHGGFIPWDDDLDICMLRSDYNRFFEIASKELPEGFQVLTIGLESEYEEIVGRIVNSNVIDYGKEHMDEFYGCPYTVGIDIFPLDGIYDDAEKEADRNRRAKKLLKKLEQMDVGNKVGAGHRNATGNAGNLKRRHELLCEIEKVYSECSDIDVEYVGLMPFFIPEGHHKFPKSIYDQIIELPFENTYLNAPACYNKLLGLEYGEYMRVYKAGGMHDYPVYSNQESVLREHLKRNPFRYTLNLNEVVNSIGRYAKKLANPSVNNAQKTVVFLPCRACWWKSMEPLWKKYSQDENTEVHVLPIFYYDCDHDGSIGEKHDERTLFPDYVNIEDCEKFDFEGIHPDVIVMQVPYDGWNTAMTVHEFFYSGNLLKFTDELVYLPCFEVDDPTEDGDKASVSLGYLIEQEAVVNADRVFVKSQKQRELYVDKLTSLSSEESRKYWEQKIVVPENNADEGDPGQHSVNRKDESGEDVRKLIVYYVTISFIVENGKEAIDKIRRNFAVFNDASDKVVAYFVPQDRISENLKRIDGKLYEEYLEVIHEISVYKNVVYDECGAILEEPDEWDAYYGDAGLYARQCVVRGIPVMIQNAEV